MQGACCLPAQSGCSHAAVPSTCSGTFQSTANCSTAGCTAPPDHVNLNITAVSPVDASVPVGRPTTAVFNITVGAAAAGAKPIRRKSVKERSQQQTGQAVDVILSGFVDDGLSFQEPLPAGAAGPQSTVPAMLSSC